MTMAATWWSIEELSPMQHTSVMVSEVLEALSPASGGVVLDATLGAGGHTEALLSAFPELQVIGVDRDASALALAEERLRPFAGRVRFVHAPFGCIQTLTEELEVVRLAGIVADLGVSSMQLDRPERGMSFRAEGPIDMRMDPSRGETALELIDRLNQDELADVLYELGEERASRRVARSIKLARENDLLHSTTDLRRAVVRAVGPSRGGGIDPATRTFQALRIAVNEELNELRRLLEGAHELLCPDGVLCVISFHSLEDRLVKRTFMESKRWSRLFTKPRQASPEEKQLNPRSRSAKLRAARAVRPSEVANDVEFAELGEGETED